MTHTATMKKAPPRHAHGALTPDKLRRFADRFEGKPAYRIAQNAVAQTSVEDVALNRAVITATDHTFSHLPDEWSATNQKKESGNGPTEPARRPGRHASAAGYQGQICRFCVALQ